MSQSPLHASPSDPAARLTIKGSVATIELNRPKTLNSINLTMATTLRDLGREITERDDVRVVVLVGAGEAFCGGGDVEFFSENMDNITASVRQLLTAFHEFHVSLWHSSKLVIASVHGAAAGAGFSLVTMADFCIASTDARLVPAYARLGVSPDGGGTYGLVRTVGSKRALQIFLAQEQLTAEEALACGLVFKIVPLSALREATEHLAARLAKLSPEAVRGTKRLVSGSQQRSLEDQLIDEMDALVTAVGTDGFRANVNRFIGKSK